MTLAESCCGENRGGEIRTRDLLNPIQARYRAAPRPGVDREASRSRDRGKRGTVVRTAVLPTSFRVAALEYGSMYSYESWWSGPTRGRRMRVASYRLQVLISGSLENRLAKAARRARSSRGAWVRRAIEERLERESGGLPPDPLAALRQLGAPTADIDVMIAEIEAGRS